MKKTLPAAPATKNVQKLWTTYLKTREVELRNELVMHYSPLVQTHAARLSRKLPAQVSYDEICSAAYGGLIEAVEAFDPIHKTKFETFCQQRISGAVMDWLRSLDAQSRTVRNFEKRVVEIREMLDAAHGRTPTHHEIAANMGVTMERYEQLCRLSQLGKAVHFSAMEPQADHNGHGAGQPWDVGDDEEGDPGKIIARELLAHHITENLEREERLILQLYYYEDLTMAEIGMILNLSESRVSQIHKSIVNRLRVRYVHDYGEELVA